MIYYFLKVFGYEISNMRVLSVIFSAASVPFFYLLIKEVHNRKMAVFALAFYVMLFNVVLFSRIDTLLYFPVFVLVAGLYFLLAGIRKGNIFLLALAGVMAGLNMYTYHSGKIHIAIMFIAFFIYAVDFKRIKKSWKNTANLSVILFAALVVFLPLLYFIVTQYNVFMARASGFAPKMDLNVIKFFMGNILEIINALTVKGSNYEYVNLPFRTIFVGVQQFLFVLGGAYVLYGIKRKNNALLLVWLFMSVLPEVFFIHHASPYYFRMMLAFPAFAVLPALGCNVVYRYASEILRGHKKNIYVVIFSFVFLYSAVSSFNDYFNRYAKSPKVMDQFDYVASEIEKMITDNRNNIVYYSGYIQNIRSLFCVYCGDTSHVIKKDVSSLMLSDFYTADNRDVVIIAENIYAYYFDYLKEYFPNIIINKVENKEGLKLWVDPIRPEFKYIFVKIPNADIKEAFGLKAE
ncbi:MAG TPA: glycosyltransferase family 39 protein, partial [Candidatus Goldiibacteriota bacterium]|nr:glycosyltransferase family 39 protein [Candidatus Goldiibacteriota bacterium]